MTTRDPDELLLAINRSMLMRALAISVAVHAVLVFGTSFSLYRDWRSYGLHAPSEIKRLKRKAEEEAKETARREAAAKRAEEAAAAQAAEGAKPADGAAPATTNTPPATAAGTTTPETTASTNTPPQAPEIAPLPPKTSFTLGDDLNLD